MTCDPLRQRDKKPKRHLAKVRTWAEARGLRLHPDKTHLGDCRAARTGFPVLGLSLRGRATLGAQGRASRPSRTRSAARRDAPAVRRLAQIVADLNPMLRGWFGYLKHAYRNDVPWHRRLPASAPAGHPAPPRAARWAAGRSLGDHQRWPNAFFAAYGLFTMTEAHAAGEPIPMRKQPTGEPYVGEPPVRFGGRGGESLPYPYGTGWLRLWERRLAATGLAAGPKRHSPSPGSPS